MRLAALQPELECLPPRAPPTLPSTSPHLLQFPLVLFCPHTMWFSCPQCNRRCKSLSGLSRHQNSVHQNDPRLSVPLTELRRIYHPNLNGTYHVFRPTPPLTPSPGERCDRDGTPVPPNAPPGPQVVSADDDWSPFSSRAGFELAEYVFTDAELSRRKIDKLLELWAATLVPHDAPPPITNHQDLYHQIDAIELGDVRWENARLKYDGPPLKQHAHLSGKL